MNIDFDVNSLYEFLTNTPEQGLRKMLVDGKPMTDVHFNLLMKVVKHGGYSEFEKCVTSDSFPAVRLSPAETKLKEKFWGECTTTFKSRGLLQPMVKAA